MQAMILKFIGYNRMYMVSVTETLLISLRVRCQVHGVFWPKGQSKWKNCWMHDQGRRKRSSFLFHMPGRLGSIPTPVATNWNGLLKKHRCLLLLLLLKFGCFLIMYPCSNSNARKRPRSKAFGDPWGTCMRCMPMRVP